MSAMTEANGREDTTGAATPSSPSRMLSPLPSTPTSSTSPASSSLLPIAERVCTPLSLFPDSAPASNSNRSSGIGSAKLLASDADTAATVRQRYLAMSSPTAAGNKAGADAAARPVAGSGGGDTTRAAAAAAHNSRDTSNAGTGNAAVSTAPVSSGPEFFSSPSSAASAGLFGSDTHSNFQSFSHEAPGLLPAPLFQNSSAGAAARFRGQQQQTHPQMRQHEPKRRRSNSVARDPPDMGAATTAIQASSPEGFGAASSASASTFASPSSAASAGLHFLTLEDPPLRTGSVQPGTKLAHPKPILHVATDGPGVSKHYPDLTRSASALSNIAQLEATAQRLSMTSSIGDAIRDLHCELKRSDSRRSEILAARAASADEQSPVTRLRRHPSASSRQRGYSPAAHVMSPTNSLTGRMRSGSNNSAGRPEHDVISSILSRHGPGKSSVRSVRSAKPSLAEISESEPISLTQTVLDEVDTAPPIPNMNHGDSARYIIEQDAVKMPTTDDFHQMLQGGFGGDQAPPNLALMNPHDPQYLQPDDPEDRPMTSHSVNTFQQARDAFADFDGAHCETDNEDANDTSADMDMEMEAHEPEMHMEIRAVHDEVEDDLPTPRRPSAEFVRPQSYFDPSTGQKMLYYPARVPAMLNLPPKLSNKPKSAQRDQRRSQVLSMMMESREAKRKSVVPDLDEIALPDPLSGHRNSFAALSTADRLEDTDSVPTSLEDAAPRHDASALAPEVLRRPQRLSRMDPNNRKSNATQLANIPPQLRASAFFDMPAEAPEIEVKDGSAMATLESILDASANAPVNAFTDHLYAGKLGSEVYGKERAHKPSASVQALGVPANQPPKKRSSFMLLGKRSSHSLEKEADISGASTQNGTTGNESHETDSLLEGQEHDEDGRQEESEEELEPEAFDGPPTTLLAELQMRKQQQKKRVQNAVHVDGMRATLLEMDAVAETQRQQRSKQRINLAWEDADAHDEHNESDNEDVPLAILAAKQAGAKNMLDVERPLGLMEIREMEENEPLSARQARLQGRAPDLYNAKRQSTMTLLPATRMAEVQPPAPPPPQIITPEPEEPVEEEIEEETLGARKRRLAESQLPKARPVSNAFSNELLSQFGDLDEATEEGKPGSKDGPTPNLDGEEETLGQRRRRLQAEREARDREMSYNNLVGGGGGGPAAEPIKKLARRLSLADVLAEHQKGVSNPRTMEERRLREEEIKVAEQQVKLAAMRAQMPADPTLGNPRSMEQRRLQEEQMRIAEQEARMAAVRAQMPTNLTGPSQNRSGGFRGGQYNDGTGGYGGGGGGGVMSPAIMQSRSFTNTGVNARASMVMNGYAAPRGPMHQQSYSSLTGLGTMNNGMAMHHGANTMSMYGAGNMYGGGNIYGNGNLYGGQMLQQGMVQQGMLQPGMPMQMPPSMDRVERWRQSIQP